MKSTYRRSGGGLGRGLDLVGTVPGPERSSPRRTVAERTLDVAPLGAVLEDARRRRLARASEDWRPAVPGQREP
ncbi:hypothetical protein [Kitasatospora kifunensis]|uniref:Uncharacterized protein n=1 Tax=Kitasatospora kifunensis TaxID=58351 RepID=A0A7W7RBX2_KITKI|nr:hypothetical protein [Kitasatospora kifunensis]MBB4929133.1 hypothetical protein [Kitasatospora kifunensis]